MTELSFDFKPSTDVYEADYKGYTIKVSRDSYPENPWESWCHQTPMAVRYDGCVTEYSKEHGATLNPLSYYTDGQIIHHWKAIIAILTSYNNHGHYIDEDIEYQTDHGATLSEAKVTVIQEYDLDENFDLIAELWELIKVPVLSTSSQGYSQGCCSELLLVMTPEIVKLWGTKKSYIKKNWKTMLENDAKIYGAWAWGDVYGYNVIDSNGEEIDASCWGFYGDEFNESGLVESVVSEIDYEIRARKKNRVTKLIAMIKSKTPLAKRKEILSAMPA